MTTILDLPEVTPGQLNELVQRVVRSYHHRQEEIVQAEFAAMVSRTLRQMRPPASEAGERAAGIRAGLEMAEHTILRLAGVPSTSTPVDHQETSHAHT